MKLIRFYHADLLNGKGLREVIFLSGCEHHCKGCFSPETWDPDMPEAHEWSEKDWEELKEYLSRDYIDGVTFSGGDPLSIWNANDVYGLCKRIKEEFPEKTIWLYTGWTFEKLNGFQYGACSDVANRYYAFKCVNDFVDVLCDGPFIEEKKSPSKPWVGSENQRVIDVKKSLEKGEIVLWEEN